MRRESALDVFEPWIQDMLQIPPNGDTGVMHLCTVFKPKMFGMYAQGLENDKFAKTKHMQI